MAVAVAVAAALGFRLPDNLRDAARATRYVTLSTSPVA